VIADALTVAWKELREFSIRQRGLGRGLLGTLMIPLVLGIFLPWQEGQRWVSTSPFPLVFSVWMPLLFVSSVIADSFADERERHTLETLLASRLSEGGILFGKLAAAVGYAWGMTLFSLLLGLVTVNLIHGRGELLLYPAEMAGSMVLLSLLGAGLMGGIGVLVSLRSPTVRQAQQVMYVVSMALLFGVVYAFRALPLAWREALLQPLLAAGVERVVLAAAAALLLLDGGLLAAAMVRFRRARLILD